jgi:hypothetical protein
VCSYLDENVHLMWQHYPICLLKVKM